MGAPTTQGPGIQYSDMIDAPNLAASVDAPIAALFAFDYHRRRTTEQHRWAQLLDRIKMACLLLLTITTATGVRAAGGTNDSNWEKLSGLRDQMEVEVISGNEVKIIGIRCRLLGIVIPDEPKRQLAAKRFLELYIKDYRPYFGIYNSHSPVNDKDGVPLIWLRGIGNGGWAQETLVQAGLATPSYFRFEGYKFSVMGKQGEHDCDWKGILNRAEDDYRRGAKPNINFEWSEKS